MPDLLTLGDYLLGLTEEELARRATEATDYERATMTAAFDAIEARKRAQRWLYDPVGWVEAHVDFAEAAGNHALAPYQREAMAELVRTGRLAMRSPHGVGKTALAALTILWFALTRDAAGIDWKVPTTASVYRQLRHYLWPEIHQWANRLRWEALGRLPFTRLELQVTGLKLAAGESWAMASSNPANIEGAHARHLLYVFDEAKSIDADVWDAAEGAFSGAGEDTDAKAWALAVSTPGVRTGRFYAISTHRLRGWSTLHVTRAEAIAEGRMSREWAAHMDADFGASSPIVRQRVDGEFADDVANQIIPLEWVEQAIERWYAIEREVRDTLRATHTGLDVARGGRDRNCLAVFADDVCLRVDYLGAISGAEVAAAALVNLGADASRVVWSVDSEGVGASPYDHLAASDLVAGKLFAFRAGAGCPRRDVTGQLTFANMRAAGWWALRDRLDPTRPHYGEPTLALPPHEDVIGDLTAPTWSMKKGRIVVESKDEIRSRLGRSTDAGDAVVMGAWGTSVVTGLTATAAAATERAADRDRFTDSDDTFSWNQMTTSM